MKRFPSANFAVFCICLGAGQSNAAANGATDATAPVPPTVYQSPFTGYRELGVDQTTAWKDANDTVRNIGGWKAYAKEAGDASKAGSRTKPASMPLIPLAPALLVPAAPKAPAAPAPAPAEKPAAPQHKHGG